MGGRVEVATILNLIEADGFTLTRTAGSHHTYSNDDNGRHVTVPWSNKGDALPIGTAKSIARQAGPRVEHALTDVMRGGHRLLKQHVKALKKGMSS